MSAEDNIKRIQNSLRSGYYAQNPHEVAEDRAILSGEFSWICGQLESILQRKPAIWNELRKLAKSDTATERIWQQTLDGLDEEGLRLKMKACEKMMTGLGTLIRLATEEAKNNL